MLKRIFDIFGACLALVLFFPVISFVAWKVAKTMGRPVFFRQVRPGQDGKPFEMIKFRTMRDANGPDGKPLPDADRITPFGSFMRRASLDELPEFWNVLKGDMSLVGPRPLLIQYLPLYSKEQYRRHEMKPGITGWAQINGRNAISWDEKFKLDVWYVNNQSVWLDMKILSLTVKKVILREGISSDDHATMPFFEGTQTGTATLSSQPVARDKSNDINPLTEKNVADSSLDGHRKSGKVKGLNVKSCKKKINH
ncbi:sugar transferase [Endozoicomonas ascidiicola]|uniref:sugar transferase n=1 Tax=Endozoicomonas ascidiicola TaxID=1698521 RepID=UPI000ABF27D3|nr:sugar transferase [Endozoicomonas ascidiicola]